MSINVDVSDLLDVRRGGNDVDDEASGPQWEDSCPRFSRALIPVHAAVINEGVTGGANRLTFGHIHGPDEMAPEIALEQPTLNDVNYLA